MTKMNEKQHHRALLLLNQSMRDCSPDEIADAMFELVALDQVFEILDRVFSKHQKRLEEIVAAEAEEKGGTA
jgi:hypothetical protein